ncbi:MerR family transcriptional regulator [Mobilitalea sibirica]|uniref:MerR family transcriptional regulator n=1 Tax=Mobilitalea sibirica TaxID=1462919 RepID=A0A8J7GYI5_9FIRM|nr:MerR family transcriptional regulator [Mobilitalea sibirica]MBH1940569.1 MerR family transcriptional regulator [Mobilitalea sibirica]
MQQYYSIGQIASICSISIQTLRYYDKINLIKPSYVDRLSNYRYYTDADIKNLRIIIDMKDTGLSLEEIKDCLYKENYTDITYILEKKREEYLDKLKATNTILSRINYRLENLKLQDRAADTISDFINSIEIKEIPKRTVAYTRYMSSCSHDQIVKRYFDLDNLLKREGLEATGSRIAIYHDFLNNFNPLNCDFETCIPIKTDIVHKDFIRVIKEGLYATGIFKGTYEGQCSVLVEWIKEKGFQITGPGVEVYINSFMNTKFPKNYITEVQFPIKRC